MKPVRFKLVEQYTACVALLEERRKTNGTSDSSGCSSPPGSLNLLLSVAEKLESKSPDSLAHCFRVWQQQTNPRSFNHNNTQEVFFCLSPGESTTESRNVRAHRCPWLNSTRRQVDQLALKKERTFEIPAGLRIPQTVTLPSFLFRVTKTPDNKI